MGIYELLMQENMTVTTAESCTGGLVASALVDIPGISSFFREGYITYAPEAKERILGVPKTTIQQYGVVSIQTAAAMAKGAAQAAKADCSVATTGVAGPDGGTRENPVGTVCFGCCVRGQTFTERKIFDGDRKQVRTAAADYAVRFLQDCIGRVIMSGNGGQQ